MPLCSYFTSFPYFLSPPSSLHIFLWISLFFSCSYSLPSFFSCSSLSVVSYSMRNMLIWISFLYTPLGFSLFTFIQSLQLGALDLFFFLQFLPIKRPLLYYFRVCSLFFTTLFNVFKIFVFSSRSSSFLLSFLFSIDFLPPHVLYFLFQFEAVYICQSIYKLGPYSSRYWQISAFFP